MSNPFDEYERELDAKAKRDIAAEDAAFAALPQAERDRIIAEREARLAEFWAAAEAAAEDEPDEDEEDES